MLSSSGRGHQPREVRIRVPRLTAALISIVTVPLTLSACGLVGGDRQNEVPVIVPTANDDVSPLDTVSPLSPGATAPTGSAPTQLPPATRRSTVTRTGVMVQEKTHNITATHNLTATTTLPQIIVTVAQAPITVTETKREIRTVTAPVITISLPPAGR